jgi:hypothetical protein
MAAKLRGLGFEVVEGKDLTKADMDRTIRSFAETVAGAEMALFFYAGHGLQVSGQNYLVPIDAKLTTTTAAALDFEMVRLDLIQRTLEREASTNIIILDACRDNPLSRNLARALGIRSAAIGRGLAAVESGEGTLISFSTQPGNVALDGAGRNSPVAATPTYEQQAELAFWASVKDSRNPAMMQAYVERFPDGMFAGLARLLIEQLRTEAERAAMVGAREADLKKADEDRRLAEQQRAEAERKAVEARQAEELRKAQEEAQRAREALSAAEKDRETAQKAAEDARKARDEARKAVEATAQQLKVASLERVESTSASALVERDRLVRELETELKRVGCDPGTPDGKWGPKARAALSEFVTRTKTALSTDDATAAALGAVKAHRDRVCPIRCSGNEVEQDGRCRPRSADTHPQENAAVPRARETAGLRSKQDDVPPCAVFNNGSGKRCRDTEGKICLILGGNRFCRDDW